MLFPKLNRISISANLLSEEMKKFNEQNASSASAISKQLMCILELNLSQPPTAVAINLFSAIIIMLNSKKQGERDYLIPVNLLVTASHRDVYEAEDYRNASLTVCNVNVGALV